MARIHWSVSSRRDLREIGAYIAADSPRHARVFVARLRAAAERLADFPDIGRRVPDLNDPNLREILVRSYRIMYRVDQGDVYVAAIVHGARDVGAMRRNWKFD